MKGINKKITEKQPGGTVYSVTEVLMSALAGRRQVRVELITKELVTVY